MEVITNASDLERAANEWLAAPVVALDTEFFWERTFYPILGVVQVATGPDRCWLVDAVQVRDLGALGPVLAARSVTKILHDAVQDLGILRRATGTAAVAVFDTRLAAGFAGLSSTCSLQALLHDVLGVDLAKAETRSDWLRRPLSAAQLRYAADDVVHLPELRDRLLARCSSDRVRGWLSAELLRLDDPANYDDRDPREMFRRVKGTARLDARQLAVLREVADWREQEARQRDWPRGHVLADDVLVDLACRAPADRAALGRVPGLPERLPDDVVARILAAVACGSARPADQWPEPADQVGPAVRRGLKAGIESLSERVRQACAAVGIDPALVASRSDIERYVRLETQGSTASHPLAQGWRQELLGSMAPPAGLPGLSV
jgi:ribonuclease D